MFTAGNPLRELFRGFNGWWQFAPAGFPGPARRTRESSRISIGQPRKVMFEAMQSLGRVSAGSAAETVSPWKRFDKALARAVAEQKRGYLLINLPPLPRNIRRKVRQRTDRHINVQVRFNQKNWNPSPRW
jgi:hypothetical protein